MAAEKATYQYNVDRRRLTIINPSGKRLVVNNVSEAQATEFAQRHAKERAQRGVSGRSASEGFFTR
jgi:hypothetical protein